MPPKVNIKKLINKSLDKTKTKLRANPKKKLKPMPITKSRKIIKTNVEKITGGVEKPDTPLSIPNNLNVIKEVAMGRNDYPVRVLNLLKTYGDIPIVDLSLKRTPVSQLLTTVLSTLSKDFKKRLQNSEYDKLFHLYLEITLVSGKKLVVEKNEVINMMISSKRPEEEIRPITKMPKNLTINILMNNTHKSMGANFFTYSANNNNCQDFIVSMLRANKIGNASDISFVKQDTKFLFKNLPYLRKFSNTVTTTGARIDSLKNII